MLYLLQTQLQGNFISFALVESSEKTIISLLNYFTNLLIVKEKIFTLISKYSFAEWIINLILTKTKYSRTFIRSHLENKNELETYLHYFKIITVFDAVQSPFV